MSKVYIMDLEGLVLQAYKVYNQGLWWLIKVYNQGLYYGPRRSITEGLPAGKTVILASTSYQEPRFVPGPDQGQYPCRRHVSELCNLRSYPSLTMLKTFSYRSCLMLPQHILVSCFWWLWLGCKCPWAGLYLSTSPPTSWLSILRQHHLMPCTFIQCMCPSLLSSLGCSLNALTFIQEDVLWCKLFQGLELQQLIAPETESHKPEDWSPDLWSKLLLLHLLRVLSWILIFFGHFSTTSSWPWKSTDYRSFP